MADFDFIRIFVNNFIVIQINTFFQLMLTAEEQQAVAEFAKQIDVTNANQVLMYGAGAQKNIADFSENALNNVRTKDLGEVGEALSSLVVELKNLDFDTTEEKK